MYYRPDNAPPQAIAEWGWRFHHVGIPTERTFPDETYLPDFKFFVSGFPESPFGIEWMRFEPGSPVNQLIQEVAHVAFEVDDLERELQRPGITILTPPNSPSEGARVAMIVHNGAPIELIEFTPASRFSPSDH